jgi:predicted glycosyltransferase
LLLVWLDALTPKQARLAAVFADALEEMGHRAVVTCRDYDYTVSTLRMHGRRPIVVGRHGGAGLRGKLRADAERILGLLDALGETPDALVSYPSPSAVRTAFGLGIPVVLFNDTPHAEAACRLACPLASVLVYSEFIPRGEMERYVLRSFTRTRRYRGVEELAWILRTRPDPRVPESLGLEPSGYVVVRPEERKASYYGGGPDVTSLALRLAARGVRVVFLPRYRDQAERVRGVEKIIVPREAVEGVSLEYYAAAVVTGGGTMAREAALLGVPGINLFPGRIHVDEALASMGFPYYKPGSLEEAEALALRFAENPERTDTRSLLRGLEDPAIVMIEEVEGLNA